MKKRFIFLTLFLGLCLVSGFALNEKPLNQADGKAVFVPDEVVVVYSSSATAARKAEIVSAFGLTQKRESAKPGKYVVYKHADPASVVSSLKNEADVLYAEQNAYAYALEVPNDPYYSYQWHMPQIGMEEAWEISHGSSNVIVAIIDTGVKQDLEDLNQTLFMPGWDFVNNDNDPTDDDGHGSHVCGTAAQSTNNGIGVTGIAYQSTIMPVKVLDENGSGTYNWITDGIYYAVDHGADVINMSLGGYANLQILEDAVNYAWNNGVVVVCAAGNDSTTQPMYPAAYENSISVSATNYLKQLTFYSNYGPTIDMCAPGGDLNDYNGDGYMDGVLQNTFQGTSEGYWFFIGTSQASPHVAGTAALCKAIDPTLTNVQIRSILETTAEDLGAPGWDQYFGHGLVDAYAAAQAAVPSQDYIFLRAIKMDLIKVDGGIQALAYVYVQNTDDQPVGGAVVIGTWSGDVHGRAKAETNNEGLAVLKSPIWEIPTSYISARPIVFIITIDDILHPDYEYNPELNKVPPVARIYWYWN